MTGTVHDTSVDAARQRRAKVAAELASATMYELIGGAETLRAVVDRFYDLMDVDPSFAELRALHADDLSPMRVSLFEFLSGWVGGPPLFVERNGSPCIMSVHRSLTIDTDVTDQWVTCMSRAMADAGVALEYRELLEPPLAAMADGMRTVD